MQLEQPSIEVQGWNQRASSANDMRQISNELTKHVNPGCVIYFEGELGTGKTTLIQGIFHALNVNSKVLSPTFSVLKPYTSATGLELLHVDLYRIEDQAELLLIGIEDFIDKKYSWFIEWPERGFEVIPPPDIRVKLNHADTARDISVEFVG